MGTRKSPNKCKSGHAWVKNAEVTVNLAEGVLSFNLNGKNIHRLRLPQNSGLITLHVWMENSKVTLRECSTYFAIQSSAEAVTCDDDLPSQDTDSATGNAIEIMRKAIDMRSNTKRNPWGGAVFNNDRKVAVSTSDSVMKFRAGDPADPSATAEATFMVDRMDHSVKIEVSPKRTESPMGTNVYTYSSTGQIWGNGKDVAEAPRLTARSEVRVLLAANELFFYHNDDKAHSFTLPENCGPMMLSVSVTNSQVTMNPAFSEMYKFQPHPTSGFLMNTTQLSCQECGGKGRIGAGMLYGYDKACPKCNPWRDVKFPDLHLIEGKSRLHVWKRTAVYMGKAPQQGPTKKNWINIAYDDTPEEIVSVREDGFGKIIEKRTVTGVVVPRRGVAAATVKLVSKSSLHEIGVSWEGGRCFYSSKTVPIPCPNDHNCHKFWGTKCPKCQGSRVSGHRDQGFVNLSGKTVEMLPRFPFAPDTEITVSLAGGELEFYCNGTRAYKRNLPKDCGPISLCAVVDDVSTKA